MWSKIINTGFSRRTLAVIGSNAVVARAAVEAEPLGAVVDVDLTVDSGPSVDTDTQVAASLVVTRRTVPTWIQRRTLVNVHRTEST